MTADISAAGAPALAEPVAGESWIARAHRDHVLESWSTQSGPTPMVVTGGQGCWFFDDRGNRYLDFMSQLVNLNLGHQHPRLVEAIAQQARTLTYIGPSFATEARSQLAIDLSELTPGNLTASFFTTGGAAANEAAIAIARLYTGRHKIITRYRSYHGATLGALSASGDRRRWGIEPTDAPGVVRMLDPYVRGGPEPAESADPRNTAAHLEEILSYENPASVAAVLLETVTGTNGPIVPPDGYLQSVREVCDRHGILLICDEVMVGFGRLGTWFGVQKWDVVPDILTVAKGINSGYVPLGATVVGAHIRDQLRMVPLPTGLTYAGHPLACGSAVAAIQIMKDERVVENAARQGDRLRRGLLEMVERHQAVRRVRGTGLLQGIELGEDSTGALLAESVVRNSRAKGLWVGRYDNVIRLSPPLIIAPEEVDLALSILDDALRVSQGESR